MMSSPRSEAIEPNMTNLQSRTHLGLSLLGTTMLKFGLLKILRIHFFKSSSNVPQQKSPQRTTKTLWQKMDLHRLIWKCYFCRSIDSDTRLVTLRITNFFS